MERNANLLQINLPASSRYPKARTTTDGSRVEDIVKSPDCGDIETRGRKEIPQIRDLAHQSAQLGRMQMELCLVMRIDQPQSPIQNHITGLTTKPFKRLHRHPRPLDAHQFIYSRRFYPE